MKRLFILVIGVFFILSSFIAIGAVKKTTCKGKLNINSASSLDLQKIPYLGAKKAEGIISYREKNTFSNIEEIMKVKGVSKKIFLKIKDYIKVDGTSDFELVKNQQEKSNS